MGVATARIMLILCHAYNCEVVCTMLTKAKKIGWFIAVLAGSYGAYELSRSAHHQQRLHKAWGYPRPSNVTLEPEAPPSQQPS